jgi:S-DNA-T family DNA segregation ATPase FtsK/SpoIIIE
MAKNKDLASKNKGEPQTEVEVTFFDKLSVFFDDDRPRKIAGLICMLFAIVSVGSILSYFSTWQNDQDEVFQFSWRLLWNGTAAIENKMGRLGAILSHALVYNGFGIASLVVPYLFLLSGINLLFTGRKRKIIYNTAASVPLLFFCSTALSVFLGNEAFPYGGGIGNVISTWLLQFVGYAGTLLLLGFCILTALVAVYNINIAAITSLWRKPEVETNKLIDASKTATAAAPVVINEEEEEDELTPFITTKPDLNTTFAKTDDEPFLTFEPTPAATSKPATQAKPAPPVVALELDEPFLTLAPVAVASPKAPEAAPIAPEDAALQHVFSEEEFTPFDPTLELSEYKFPKIDLLIDYVNDKGPIDKEELQRNSDQIIQTLNNYNIEISKIKATVGPTVTLYEIIPAAGVRISKIKNLEDDIALSLSALGIRIIAPMPGKGTIGIEVPNINKEVVSMRSVIASPQFTNSTAELPVGMGKTINNEIFVFDLAKMPHLLMAGATGQGKSVGLNAVLASLLYKKHPSQLKLVLIDPKKVELSLYKLIEKHFLAKLPGEADPIITDIKKVIATLNSLCIEMDERYDLLKIAQVRNIVEYNKKFIERRLNPNKGHRFMPYIVLVIDEFADLIMTAGKEIEMPIARLAQLARAIGIHLIVATQRPSVNIITGTIKANFPGRIAFKVSSKIDSRTILDAGGAEQLIGKGDMLINSGGDLVRVQCAYLDLPEVEALTEFIGKQRGYSDAYLLPEFVEEGADAGNKDFDMSDRDPMFADAARVIVASQQGSTSMIQRRLKLGYNRAGRLMDQLEGAGIVGPNEGSKAREVLVKTMEELEQFLLTHS